MSQKKNKNQRPSYEGARTKPPQPGTSALDWAIALAILGIVIGGACLFMGSLAFEGLADHKKVIENLADKLEDEGYRNDRWQGDAEQLDIQLGNICRDFPKHTACRWYTEEFKERG